MDKHPSRERSASATLELRVSAIVVARNAGPSLDLCLRSAMAEPWIDDIIVVDHGNSVEVSSALRSMQLDRRDMKMVKVDRSESYAAAANRGAEHALGRWLLFLHPDVVMQRGSVGRMAIAGGDTHASPWIVGGRLTDTDGRDRPAARKGALTTWSAIAVAMNLQDGPKLRRRPKRGANEQPPPAPPTKVAAVSGAFMLIPRADFDALAGFDESFTSDGADLDLCRRAAEQGGSVLFHPAAAGIQFMRPADRDRREAQGLALFAKKSAKTPIQRIFAEVAGPALVVLLTLRDVVFGRPPIRR